MADSDENLVGFCSAAWTDLIAYSDGSLRVCDRNIADFGNWQKEGLAATWNSNSLKKFRKDTAEGRYPNEDCASCHNNGTQRTLVSSLACAYEEHYLAIERHLGKAFAAQNFLKTKEIFTLKKYTLVSDAIIAETVKNLGLLESRLAGQELCKELRDALVKIRVILECAEDYLHGTIYARRVAPFRQAQLQAKCNARCMMCAGRYTGEIMNGPSMPTNFVEECFARLEDVVDFWCNGSEYMLYKDWQKIATMLYQEGGTKARVSTNGILLQEKNVHFLIDTGMLAHLTVSLDGATKEVLESIRINVKYEETIQKIRYLIEYAGKKNHFFTLVFAFCFMKRNYRDLPEFLRMIHRLRGEFKNNRMVALIQPLENFELLEYRKWVHQEHHDLIGQEEVRRVLRESYEFAKEHDIFTSFYNMKLEEFLDKKLSMPPYFVRKLDEEIYLSRMDEIGKEIGSVLEKNKDYFLSLFTARMKRSLREYLLDNNEAPFSSSKKREKGMQILFDSMQRQSEMIAQFLWNDRMNNPITNEIVKVFSSVRLALKEKISEHVGLFSDALRFIGEEIVQDWEGNNSPVKKDSATYDLQNMREQSLKLYEVKSFLGYQLLSSGEIIEDARIKNNISFTHMVGGDRKRIRAFLFYVLVHKIKNLVIGNRKSKFLWNLSLLYRSQLKNFGIQVKFINEKK